jgi:para-aminobenzoate synthetase component 1
MEVRAFLERASGLTAARPGQPTTSPLVPELTREAYLERARRVLRYIEAGDVYQVNLARRLTARTSAGDVELYLRLREVSASSHAALLRFADGSVVCSSPELFLDLRERHVVTRPIKGTRPRGNEAWKDESLRRELEESEKDQAELTMIVDLLRNDLGRVCEYGSVLVSEPRAIEKHPTVFHQVATIEGTLRSGEDWRTLLAATFPGGSITGAPKIRAMQIIRELEPTPRGVYCGSIGWIGLNGDASFNIAIRTMVQRGEQVELHAGGGIVAHSSPEAEFEETEVKLRGMLAALGRSERVASPEVSA